mmetsp:Transcript_74036/g.198788  ORF Transcript_74036/g.198788 Transcript_74036/m.198788 type:complete len:352 (-) Transcript_74036:71-1126(-)
MISSSPSRPSLLPPPSRSSSSNRGGSLAAGGPGVACGPPAAIQSSSAFLAASEQWSPLRHMPSGPVLFLQKPAAYHLHTPACPPAPLPKSSLPLPLPLPLPLLSAIAAPWAMASCKSLRAAATCLAEPRTTHLRAFVSSPALPRPRVRRAPDSDESRWMFSPPRPITKPTASSGTSTTSSTMSPSSTASPHFSFRLCRSTAPNRAAFSVSPMISAWTTAAAISLLSHVAYASSPSSSSQTESGTSASTSPNGSYSSSSSSDLSHSSSGSSAASGLSGTRFSGFSALMPAPSDSLTCQRPLAASKGPRTPLQPLNFCPAADASPVMVTVVPVSRPSPSSSGSSSAAPPANGS